MTVCYVIGGSRESRKPDRRTGPDAADDQPQLTATALVVTKYLASKLCVSHVAAARDRRHVAKSDG